MSIDVNVMWHKATVTRKRRESLNNHRGTVIWFTGLSGSGKSTLAHAVEEKLYQLKCRTITLDGDNVRHGLCSDLGFSNSDRIENIRRVGEVAKLFMDAGVIVLTAFISPFREDRERIRNLVGKDDFLEVFCNSSLDVCEKRDVKGLYKKAREGLIPDFTGITSPYEEPENPGIEINTGQDNLDDCVQQVLIELQKRSIILSNFKSKIF